MPRPIPARAASSGSPSRTCRPRLPDLHQQHRGLRSSRLAGGFTLGLLTAYVLASNGVMLGVLAGLEWKVGRLGGVHPAASFRTGSSSSPVSPSPDRPASRSPRALVDPGRDNPCRVAAVDRTTVGRHRARHRRVPRNSRADRGDRDHLGPADQGRARLSASSGEAAFWTLVIWRGRSARPADPYGSDRLLQPRSSLQPEVTLDACLAEASGGDPRPRPHPSA